MLDVSSGFVYSLPRTHYGAARKSKPTVKRHRGGLSRARQFSMHGLSVAPQDRSDCGTNGKPYHEGVPERLKRGKKKVVTRAVVSCEDEVLRNFRAG